MDDAPSDICPVGHLPADQPTDGRPGVIVPRPGQLDPLTTERPTPTSQPIETLSAVEIIRPCGTYPVKATVKRSGLRHGVTRAVVAVRA